MATVVLPIGPTPLLKLSWQGPKIVLLSCAIYWAHVRLDLYNKTGCIRMTVQLWDSDKLPWFQMVLTEECAVQEKEPAKVAASHQFFECNQALCCVREALLF